MTETRKLYLLFTDKVGKTATVTIPNPKEDITLEVVTKAAEDIVAEHVLENANGPLASFKGAKIITTITEVLA